MNYFFLTVNEWGDKLPRVNIIMLPQNDDPAVLEIVQTSVIWRVISHGL